MRLYMKNGGVFKNKDDAEAYVECLREQGVASRIVVRTMYVVETVTVAQPRVRAGGEFGARELPPWMKH
jgi:hypothetical protein